MIFRYNVFKSDTAKTPLGKRNIGRKSGGNTGITSSKNLCGLVGPRNRASISFWSRISFLSSTKNFENPRLRPTRAALHKFKLTECNPGD